MFTKLLPPPYKATSSVLLSQPAPGDASDGMLTEVAIAESHTVAEAAMRKLGVPVNAKSVQTFLADYTATSRSVGSDGVLLFTAKATSSSTAVDRAQAVAEAFLQVRNAELNSELAGTIKRDRPAGKPGQAAGEPADSEDRRAVANAAPVARPAGQIASLQAQRKLASGILVGLQAAAKSYETTAKVANASVVTGSGVLDGRYRYRARGLSIPWSTSAAGLPVAWPWAWGWSPCWPWYRPGSAAGTISRVR